MIAVAMYVLVQMGGGVIPGPVAPPTCEAADWMDQIQSTIADLNRDLIHAKGQLELLERPFEGPGSNMPIASYDPAMFPILTVPGGNCSGMPIYTWQPQQPPEP